ncbi:hypothetical protein [uncultured Gordonia sp.]|uniref:hypothetical protein n=1 Tax=uncultured Gordonia sp. TaxID=198437 RepID=UPI00261358F7|nr:hypothetical protein [uncultured Gordonia sp.]
MRDVSVDPARAAAPSGTDADTIPAAVAASVVARPAIEAVVEGETGLLVPAGDAAALAAAVGRIAGDGGLRAAMGAAGHGRALAAFTAAEMARAVEATYVELLGRHA